MLKRKKHHEQHHDMPEYGVVHVDTCGFDTKELLILELLRCFCLSYAEPLTQGWLSAFKRSEEVLGQVNGPMIAYNVSELLSAVRRERTNQFNFVDPRCKKCSARVFPTELALMSLVRAARMNDGDKMHSAARDVVESGLSSGTIRAGHALATCLNCVRIPGELTQHNMGMSGQRLH